MSPNVAQSLPEPVQDGSTQQPLTPDTGNFTGAKG